MWIKNIDTVDNTYAGQLIEDGTFYEIKDAESDLFANSVTLLTDICNAKAQMSETGVDAGLISNVNAQINALKRLQLVKTQQILAQDGLTSRPFGFKFTATKDTNTTHQYKLTESLSLRGGSLETDKMVFGDSFDVKIVDVDAVYYPAGTVLYDFIKDWQCHKDGFNELKEETITAIIPVNVYIEVKYKSVGTVDDVKVGMNFFGYK